MGTDQWQPIETVPRDGTIILIVKSRKGVRRIYPARYMYELDPEYPWQVLCEDYGDNFLPDDDYVTHWMPLPEPPQGDEND